MKSTDDPLQNLVTMTELPIKSNLRTGAKFFLAPNEFTDYTDSLGLFGTDPEPQKFFSVERYEEQFVPFTTSLEGLGVRYNQDSSLVLPKLDIEFVLSNKLHKFERTRYNLMMLVGDLGGFNSAVALIPSFLLSFYTPKMLQKSIASKTPVELPRQRRTKRQRVETEQGQEAYVTAKAATQDGLDE